MPKIHELIEKIAARDAAGNHYQINIYQEFAVDGGDRLPTYKFLKLVDGTPVEQKEDGSFLALGFDQIQLWPEHD
ncbi:hypothetical protein [Pseudomonas sp. AOB-7]|uniref:hypothetical protein n=1 Tax=Pseudomonas sp. AOB-7 TaxID=2482750 RepID=UPI0011C4562C|nr:hypothetical protein [Pseudomonas sp. AOB-7]